MASFNKVILMGNLTRDPELRYTPQGSPVGEFAIAINEKYTPKGGGQEVEKVHFVDITCWGKTAEIAAEYLKKGSSIHIEGKLTQDRWDDQASGQKRSKLKVTCERLTFVGGKQNGAGGQQSDASAAVGTEEDIPF